MKSLLSTQFLLIAILLFACSCNTPRFVYAPSAHNVPVLKQAGDSKLGINYSANFGGGMAITESNSNGIDAQGAVAVNNHIAVQASYIYKNEKTNSISGSGISDSNNVKYTRNSYELAAGYYTSMGKSNKGLVPGFWWCWAR